MKTVARIGMTTAVLFAGIFFLTGCEDPKKEPIEDIKLLSVKVETAGGQVLEKKAEDEAAISGQAPAKPDTSKQIPAARPAAPVAVNPVVAMTTTMGVIKIELYPDRAPQTVANFLRYVDDGFYNGTIFHRVMRGFMIQGGGFTQDMAQKPTRAPIVNECGPALRNKRGTIAMARTSAPNSATCQFFINHVDNPTLDFDGPYKPGYAVFGKVVEGLDVVDRIASVKTAAVSRALTNVPVTPVVIERIERVKP